MSRSERLFDLLQALRQHRRPVSGGTLAAETGVSIRTLYRDIASLQAMGAPIEGEAGVGYVLHPGFVLPPLMFTIEEIEALVLGSRWVAGRADQALSDAARSALARIAAVVPSALRDDLDSSSLIVGPGTQTSSDGVDLVSLRASIRAEQKLVISYRDGGGSTSDRRVWPFALAFFDSVRMLVGWCELREDFRHFRTDRIVSATSTGERYPRRRQILLREWKASEGIGR